MRGFIPYWADKIRIQTYRLIEICQRFDSSIIIPDITCPTNVYYYTKYTYPVKIIVSPSQNNDYQKFIIEEAQKNG